MFRLQSLVTAIVLCAAGLLAGFSRESHRSRSAGTGPSMAGGRPERCVSCHVKPDEDPGGAHSSEALGCASCHLGNPLAYEKERAHEGLEREPGALSTVDQTCGREDCHARESARVASSLMARGSGVISVDRWVFGEIPTPSGTMDFRTLLKLERPTRAQDHLRKLCAGCHLWTRRANRDDAILGNGSGCSACHVERRLPADGKRAHPPVDSKVTDDRCLGCHSRSGRISLSYQGFAEVTREQATPCEDKGTLHDGRPACSVAPDVHQTAGMACIDCHLHTDLMGDGHVREHKEEQVEITCESCHGPAEGERRWDENRDPITKDLVRMLKATRPADELFRAGRSGTPVWNLQPVGGRWFLTSKVGGRRMEVRQTPEDAKHRLKGHERLTCSACHSAWAPRCDSCHVSHEPSKKQWDYSIQAEVDGAWVEKTEGYGWGPPALGVRQDGRIVPVVPGMILEVDPAIRARLFASLEPHTTGKKARDCSSCHRSSLAIGLGAGTIEWSAREPLPRRAGEGGVGAPRFLPDSPSTEGVALGGWTSMGASSPGTGTRPGLRSFDRGEMDRILLVGECVTCHERARDRIYESFERSAARLNAGGSSCRFSRSRIIRRWYE